MRVGGHFGFMQIRKIAQSCQSGNQAKFALEPHVSANQQKNFIVPDISRSSIWHIELSAGLLVEKKIM